jgi:hypothetical protein
MHYFALFWTCEVLLHRLRNWPLGPGDGGAARYSMGAIPSLAAVNLFTVADFRVIRSTAIPW